LADGVSWTNGFFIEPAVVQRIKKAIGMRSKRAIHWVAKNATPRADRPDSLGRLGTGSSLRKKRLFRMTIKPDEGFR
jgi:hypothetical protein